jgi:hypothetical protein
MKSKQPNWEFYFPFYLCFYKNFASLIFLGINVTLEYSENKKSTVKTLKFFELFYRKYNRIKRSVYLTVTVYDQCAFPCLVIKTLKVPIKYWSIHFQLLCFTFTFMVSDDRYLLSTLDEKLIHKGK